MTYRVETPIGRCGQRIRRRCFALWHRRLRKLHRNRRHLSVCVSVCVFYLFPMSQPQPQQAPPLARSSSERKRECESHTPFVKPEPRSSLPLAVCHHFDVAAKSFYRRQPACYS